MFHARKAESLIETLIAITVIVIVSTAATILIRTSMVGNEVIGEKLVALNLALEGVEAVKNIRDTNYLKLASDPDSCWNVIDVDDPADCVPAREIEDYDESGITYFLRRDVRNTPYFSWRLYDAEDLEVDGNGYLSLYHYTTGDGDEVPLYLQSGISGGFGFIEDADNSEVFRRLLTFDNDDGGADSFDVTVTVTWTIDEVEKSLSLTRTIANVY